MSSMSQIASDLYKYLTESDNRKPKAYDVQAEVLRIDGTTVWVKIPGGIDETPVSKTNNAKEGDQVMVRISGGKAWVLGNETNPATDDTVANTAMVQSNDAFEAANVAQVAADIAKMSADTAVEKASEAVEQAEIAENAANNALVQAETAENAANNALTQAGVAERAARDAQNSADIAFGHLSWVEDIVGVLELLSKNGDYQLSEDTMVNPDKWYFSVDNYHLTKDTSINSNKTYYTRSGSGTEQDPYIYTIVETPDIQYLSTYYDGEYSIVNNASGNPVEQGWYELKGIDEAIRNYVSSQLVLDDNGLWLKTAGTQTKIQLSSTDGVVLYGVDGKVIGKYGQTAQIGQEDGYHIKIDGEKLSFYQADREVAYISKDKLYITQSVVLQQMDVGTPMVNGLGGQWSWKVHANVNGQNNLYLKWIG